MKKFLLMLTIYFYCIANGQAASNNNSGFINNARHDKIAVDQAYSAIKKNLWQVAMKQAKQSHIRGLVEFVELLKYASNSNKSESYNEILLYNFLAARYNILNNQFILSKINKNAISKDTLNNYELSPIQLIDKYRKNRYILKEVTFQNKIRKAWHNKKFNNPIDERNFYHLFHSVLTKKDHDLRLEKLLWEGEVTQAMRILPYASHNKKTETNFRIAVQSSENINILRKKLGKLGNDEYSRQILLFDSIKWCDKHHMQAETINLLHQIPLTKRVHNEEWWKLIKTHLRDLLSSNNKKNYELAYRLAASHGIAVDKLDYVESEFFTGFIAARFLNNRELATKHFMLSYRYAKQDFRQARAAYWLGRMNKLKNNNSQEANYWFNIAAKNFTTFYGQTALVELNRLNDIKQYLVYPTKENKEHLKNNPLFKNYYFSLLSGNHNLAKKIGKFITLTVKTKAEVAILAEMANYFHMPDVAFNIGKIAQYSLNLKVIEALYPTPHYTHSKHNKALSFALIHQESNFTNHAKSHVGAHGLMQIMPGTAQIIANNMGVNHRMHNLGDPQINVLYGNHLLKMLSKEWDNATLLMACSYNAGSQAAVKWVKQAGDPRNMRNIHDIIDWTEMISYRETRHYAQSVLANYLIYKIMLQPNIKHDYRDLL